jgi:hypothetical protein
VFLVSRRTHRHPSILVGESLERQDIQSAALSWVRSGPLCRHAVTAIGIDPGTLKLRVQLFEDTQGLRQQGPKARNFLSSFPTPTSSVHNPDNTVGAPSRTTTNREKAKLSGGSKSWLNSWASLEQHVLPLFLITKYI